MTITVPTPPKPSWLGAGAGRVKASGKPKSIMIYGKHGTRKTSIAGSIVGVPGVKRVLHIDIDNGTEVLYLRPEIAQHIYDPEENPEGTYFIQPIASLDPNAKGQIEAIMKDITTTDYGYDAVIFDTLDVAQDVAEKAIKAQHAGSKNTFAVYGDLGLWTDELVRRLHECPYFTAVITAHEKENTNDDGVTTVTPRLSGSSKDAIGGIPSIVAHLGWAANPETGDLGLIATVGEHERYISKNRFDLPRQILNTSLPSIYKQIAANQSPVAATPATA
jgi:hypothetical protein